MTHVDELTPGPVVPVDGLLEHVDREGVGNLHCTRHDLNICKNSFFNIFITFELYNGTSFKNN